MNATTKSEAAKHILGQFDRVLIAFSGGVDSTLLAVLAKETLGVQAVLAVTADSASLARQDLAEAIQLAQELGLRHRVIYTQELSNPGYQQNTALRCYFCKGELFQELEFLAKAEHIPTILYGAIGDDHAHERPGQRAAIEQGVRAPLQEAGFTKAEIRQVARSLGLPNWNKPQNACLSSRIAYGISVTPQRLGQIEQAEAYLKAQGFQQVRVRHHLTHASIEVGQDELSRLDDPQLRQTLCDRVLACGFSTVTIDPLGYHSTPAHQT